MRWFALTIAAATIGGGFYLTRPERFKSNSRALNAIAVTDAAIDDESARIFAGGTIEGAQREISLRFEIGGRLREVLVKPGDHVARGDVLAQLEPELWELKFAEARTLLKIARAERDRLVNGASHDNIQVARANVRAAETLVREADAQLARTKPNSQSEGPPPGDLERARHKYERSLTQLLAARNRLDELEEPVRQEDLAIADSKVTLAEGVLRRERLMLEKTLLTAPTEGIILRVLAEPGELVGPNGDHELLTLVNRSQTCVRAYVEELDALNVTVGQQAVVVADGRPDQPFQGVVQSCSPYVSPKSHRHHEPGELLDIRVREVIIELSDGGDLLTGLPVDVFIRPDQPDRPDRGHSATRESSASHTPPQTAKRRENPLPTLEDSPARPQRNRTIVTDPNLAPAAHEAPFGPHQ